MAQQRGETAAGCALAIALLAVVFWPVVLTVLGVVITLGVVVWLASVHRFGQLKTICEAAQRRFGGDVCLVDGRYGVVRLTDRHGRPELPEIGLIDMKRVALEPGTWISPPLFEEVQKTLAEGPPRADGHHRLNDLIAHSARILDQSEKGENALLLIAVQAAPDQGGEGAVEIEYPDPFQDSLP